MDRNKKQCCGYGNKLSLEGQLQNPYNPCVLTNCFNKSSNGSDMIRTPHSKPPYQSDMQNASDAYWLPGS